MKIPDYVIQKFINKQQKSIQTQQEHYDIINSITDKISKLDNEIIDIAFSYGDISAHNSLSRSDVMEKIKFLENEKRAIVQSLGFVPNYLDRIPECTLCNDTGYTDELRQNMCICMKKAISDHNFAVSGIDKNQTFENFNMEIFQDSNHRKCAKNILKASLKYVESLPTPSPINLIISGKTGAGKTYVLNCIAHRAVEKGINVGFFNAYSIINSKLEAIKNNTENPSFIEYELLIIDDLGSEPMIKNITKEQIFSIINEREIRKLPTVIATNLSVEEVQDHYEDRIYSRIFSPLYSSVYELNGRDLRLE